MVVAAISLAAALAPASASAAAPTGFAGLQAWDAPTDSQFAQIGKARARVFRTTLNWAAVEPNRPVRDPATGEYRHHYDFSAYDQLFDQAARRGVRLLPVLLGSPSWSRNGTGRVVDPPSTDLGKQSFYRFAGEAVKLYGPKGSFWDGKSYPPPSGLAAFSPRANYWQVWNEPNLPNYWHNRPSAPEYATMLKNVSRSAKAGNSGAKILVAGLPWSNKYTDAPEYIGRLLGRGVAPYIDAVAAHPYAKTPKSATYDAVSKVRRVLVSKGAGSKGIFITEIGWATYSGNGYFNVSSTNQARYLKDFYSRMLSVRSSWKVRGVFWFAYKDQAPPAGKGDWWAYHTGLFTTRDRAKPAWGAFKCITGAGRC